MTRETRETLCPVSCVLRYRETVTCSGLQCPKLK
jgi:hypothetical protein